MYNVRIMSAEEFTMNQVDKDKVKREFYRLGYRRLAYSLNVFWSSCLSTLLVFVLLITFVTCEKTSPLPPKEREFFSQQLCPNPFISPNQRTNQLLNTTSFIKLKKSVHENNHHNSEYASCTFDVESVRGNNNSSSSSNSAVVHIVATSLSSVSWNFSSRKKCHKYFMFKHNQEFKDEIEIACHAGQKFYNDDDDDNESDNFEGHSVILKYQRKLKQLSFTIFSDSHDSVTNLTQLNYFQMYFSMTQGNTRSCQIQQYILEASTTLDCNITKSLQISMAYCEEYDCTALDLAVYNEQNDDKDLISLLPPNLNWPDTPLKSGEHPFVTISSLFTISVPIACAAAVVLVAMYKWYINSRMLRRRYRNGIGRCQRLETNMAGDNSSCGQSSLELRETWHLSEPSLTRDVESIPTLSGVVNSDTILALKPLIPKNESGKKSNKSSSSDLPTYAQASQTSTTTTM